MKMKKTAIKNQLSHYGELLDKIKARIRQGQTRAVLSANAEMLHMYWDIGCMLHDRQLMRGWGTAVIPKLSKDIRNELPQVKGFSERNLNRMIAFYRAYPGLQAILPQRVAKLATAQKLPQPVAKLGRGHWDLIANVPWGHHFLLLERVKKSTVVIKFSNSLLENCSGYQGIERYIMETNAKAPKKTIGRTASSSKMLSILILFLFQGRILAAETIDTSFGNKGTVVTLVGEKEDRGEIVALAPDGKIVMAGTADIKENADFGLVRYWPDGRVDVSFGRDGKVRTDLGGADQVYGLILQKDGKIITAGFSKTNGNKNFALARYTPDGNLDDTFGTGGITKTNLGGGDEIHYLALQPDEKIVAVGFSEKNGKGSFVLARYDRDGNLDSGFGNRGRVKTSLTKDDRLYSVALQSDGKIVATGSAKSFSQGNDCAVLRTHADGKFDDSFGSGGMTIVSFSKKQDVCSAVQLDTAGKIYVTGFAARGSRNSDFVLARLLPTGTIDLSFGSEGKVFTDFTGGIDSAHDLALTRGGKILASGEVQETDPANVKRKKTVFGIVRYLPDGKEDETFGSNGKIFVNFGSTENETGLSMAVQSDSKIILAGTAKRSFALVRLQPTRLP